MNLEYFLAEYLKARPLFLSLIRAKEAYLYQKYTPLKGSILDVGCGDGMFAKITFANKLKAQRSKIKNKQVKIDVGLDLKDSRIHEAKKQGIYKKLVTFDGAHIPFARNHFGSVFSNCVLEHVDKLPELLSDIYRVLAPRGIFLAPVMARPWEENLFGNMLMGSSYKTWMRKKQVHLNLFTQKQWDQAFWKAGFKVKERIGYLSPDACRLIDVCHYLSVPSLITYSLFGKWVLSPRLSKLYPVSYLASILSKNVPPVSSGAIFYILKK
jgi:SAM-dependent methyltransferase